MLRLRNLSNQYKRRTLRALYAQTQAYPYACFLDKSKDDDGNQSSTDDVPGSWGSKIHPGAVMKKLAGENVALSLDPAERPFGLAAQFYGGDLDDLGDRNEFGVWRGPASVFEVLAPAFDPGSGDLSTAAETEDGASGNEVYLETGDFGQLTVASGGVAYGTCARLMEYVSANAIIVELLV